MQELLDDDHLIFQNVQGIGPIDIVRLNIHTGAVEYFDAKSDRDRAHKKRPQIFVFKNKIRARQKLIFDWLAQKL